MRNKLTSAVAPTLTERAVIVTSAIPRHHTAASRNATHKSYGVGLALLLAALHFEALAPPQSDAAFLERQCIKDGCTEEKKLCMRAFKDQFEAAKASCADAGKERERRQCTRAKRSAFKQSKRGCGRAFKQTCRPCCAKGQITGCSIAVCGDGIKVVGEECDRADDSACPDVCRGDCTCPVCVRTVGAADPYYDRFECASCANDCTSEANCVMSGCSGEVCAAESVVTTCEVVPAPRGSCGCVDGECVWNLCANGQPIWMGRADGCVQCQPCQPPDLPDVLRDLTDQGIDVLDYRLDSRAVCLACDICPSGRFFVVLISSEDKEMLEQQGWSAW